MRDCSNTTVSEKATPLTEKAVSGKPRAEKALCSKAAILKYGDTVRGNSIYYWGGGIIKSKSRLIVTETIGSILLIHLYI